MPRPAPGAQVLVPNGTYTAGGNATNRVRLNNS